MRNVIVLVFSLFILFAGYKVAYALNCTDQAVTKTISIDNVGDFDGVLFVNKAMFACPDRDSIDPKLSVASFANKPLSPAQFALPFGDYSFCFQFENGTAKVMGSVVPKLRHQKTQTVSVNENSLDPISVQISPNLPDSKKGPCKPLSTSIAGSGMSMSSGSSLKVCRETGFIPLTFINDGNVDATVVIERSKKGCLNPTWATKASTGSSSAILLPEGKYDVCYDYFVGSEFAQAMFNHKFINNINLAENKSVSIMPDESGSGFKGLCPSTVYKGRLFPNDDSCPKTGAVIRVQGRKLAGLFDDGVFITGRINKNQGRGISKATKGSFIDENGNKVGAIKIGREVINGRSIKESIVDLNSRTIDLEYEQSNGCEGTLSLGRIE